VFLAGNLLTREAPEDYRSYTGFEATADVQLPRGVSRQSRLCRTHPGEV